MIKCYNKSKFDEQDSTKLQAGRETAEWKANADNSIDNATSTAHRGTSPCHSEKDKKGKSAFLPFKVNRWRGCCVGQSLGIFTQLY